EIQSKLQPDTDEKKEVLRIIGEISQVTNFTNSTVNSLLKAEESWLVNNFLKLFK
ncbi:MAG: hypothetical protein ACI9DJ_002646, partial [Algoriphagus sp.]